MSSSNQNLMFLSDMHSFRQCSLQVSHPNVRFALSVLQISLPEIHIQHYISGGGRKKKSSCGCSLELLRRWFWKRGFQEDLQH